MLEKLKTLTLSVSMKGLAPGNPVLRPFYSLLLPLKNYAHLSSIHRSSSSSHSSSSSSSSSPTVEELLNQASLLIPRLCQSNNLPHAIRLIDACLLIFPNSPNSSLSALSLDVLVDRLTNEPDLTQPMSLLTRLSRNSSACPHLLPIAQMLAFGYFEKRRPKEATKIFNWMLRPNSPCVMDEVTYRGVALGFCRNGCTLDALKTLRKMVGEEMVPGEELREWVFKSLLREARVREAMELDAALDHVGKVGDGFQGVANLIDQMVGVWRD